MRKIIVIAGKPYSGQQEAGRYIKEKYKYRWLNMNDLIESIYIDFKRIKQFNGCQRVIAKNDTILKNAGVLFHSFGLPEVISVKFMYNWANYIENDMPDWFIRQTIYNDIARYFPAWRKVYAREDTVDLPVKNFVVTNPYTMQEAIVAPNCILVWIDCIDEKCYQHAILNNQQYNTDLYNTKYIDEVLKIRKNADFIISNNEGLIIFHKQLNEILKVVNG